MLILVIIILGTSFLLYTLLGGADFGGGIIETFAGRREEENNFKSHCSGMGSKPCMADPCCRDPVYRLSPRIFIIITGTPYSLMMVLLGIIIRGCAFTFRNYDVGNDKAHNYLTSLFRVSSFLTPLFLGMVLGAMILGRITLDTSKGFYAVFMAPWLNLFCVTLGIFSTSLFAYISAIFLVGESEHEQERKMYVSFARKAMIVTMLTGLAVFFISWLEGNQLVNHFLQSPVSLVAVILATLLAPVIWLLLQRQKNKTLYLRIGVGIQVSLILAGWFYIQYPVLINFQNGEHLTFFNTQAPPATLRQLLIALIAGLLLVVPGFVYLFKIFKIRH